MSQTQSATSRDELVACFIPLLQEVQNMTTGSEVEQWLNTKYAVDSGLYRDLSRLIALGVKEGWAADTEVAGSRYRRSQIVMPSAETLFFSATAVLMDSTDNTQNNPEGSFRANYHLHPYGEINLVVPLNEGAALAGPNGWCYGGWTAPAPGSHHFPEVKGGAVISLTFLPAGRIAMDVKPPQHWDALDARMQA
ncbi:DUF4863 family protein [Paraburkholderia mimosarum]|uniref:4-hydroxylaminobenzoate lyase n=2 Tax=Burkholderiaceae TaxID=119060 RepID=UPI0039C41568